MRMRRAVLVLAASSVTAVATLAGPRDARAQDSSTLAAATALFDEGVRLLAQNRVDEACPKLARSQELAPSGGTVLTLADCYERQGKTASAWVAFREGAARAAAAGKSDIQSAALGRAAKLEPHLKRISIVRAAGDDTPGLEIVRDGITVKDAELNVPIPVDPGRHVVEARAPGRRKWSLVVDTSSAGRDFLVEVPRLAAEGAAPAPGTPRDASAPPGETKSDGSAQRTIGLALGGVGIVGLGLATFFGVKAMGTNDDALAECPRRNPTQCTDAGLSLTEDAKTEALVSTVLFVAGGAALAGGAVLFLTAPSSSSSSTSASRAWIAPRFDAKSAGLAAGASF